MSRGTALRRLAAHEGRWLMSLGWWMARRRIGVAPGERALGYAAAQAALVYGLTFVCGVETVGLGVLLAGKAVVHEVMLFIDVYTVLTVLGLQASAVTRPHVLGAGELRLRDGARREIRIPLERIASVRYDLRFTKEQDKNGDMAELAVGGQTSVTVELSEPVVAVRLLGQRETVRTVRFHADEGRAAVAAVRAAMAARGGTQDGDAAPEVGGAPVRQG
ncbi:hypothetical protein [Streptomyces platensis]|uniref:hypothetical protein n=1 Tax=Streptomyces platensis TaxID=58346 RepID=UPI002E81E13B|nr:hypothetical protein [Streptomyces platensis]WUB82531.1 hypothetical protein OG424_27025 [Streptomyces platensis]